VKAMEYATVIGGNLNMRVDCDTSAQRITQIPNGATIAVIEKGSVWCKAIYNSYEGYVMKKFLKFESDSDDDMITLTLSRACAEDLYKALTLSLDK
jgi:uncharacterized protein YraI